MIYVELIIFDLDGTLIDSGQDIADAVNFMLREMGLKERSVPRIISYIGGGPQELIKKTLGKKNENLLDKAFSVFTNYYRRHYADKTKLYPGVKEILEYFKDKKKIIVTNRNADTGILVLKKLGVYDYFEDITGGDDPACLKPNSCPLDKAMGRLNIKDKKNAIMVGDMHIDVLTGKQAGIATCAVTYGMGKREDIEKAKPDYIIGDISMLKEIIR